MVGFGDILRPFLYLGTMILLIYYLVKECRRWPEGLFDAYIVKIPKVDGDASPLGQRPCVCLPENPHASTSQAR